ncbi:choice-of-anchor D domain-containing protein [Myxococcota bacterium]|nr:choice-of-anchor D domain-containing protein [Myxococcota bacterium]
MSRTDRSLDVRLALCLGLTTALTAACSSEPTTALPDGGTISPDATTPSPDASVGPDAGGVSIGRVLLETDTIDFGAVVVTSTGARTITITNPGDEPVRVTLSEPAGPDAARFTRDVDVPDDDGSFVLEARGIANLTVTVSPGEEGPLLAVIALDSCAGTCPAAIVLSAIGVLTGVECPARFDLGLANPGGCVDRTVSCVNRGNATERITVADLEPTSDPSLALTPPALPVELGPSDSLDLSVRFCPTRAAQVTGSMLVATFRPFETEHVIELVGEGGGADVTCTPASLPFGTVGVGAGVELDVVCTNRGFTDATISAALTSGGDFTIASAPTEPLPAGQSATIVVRAAARAVGDLTDELRIQTNDPDAPEIVIPITATAIDAEPCVAALEPAVRELGLVGIGDTRVASLTLRNLGTTICLVRAVSIATGSSPAFSVASAPAPGTELPAGGTLTISVAFAPTANAVATGSLAVSFSNPGTTELSAELRATGGGTSLAFAPELLDFGVVPVGCAGPTVRTLVLRRVVAGTGSINSASLVTSSMSSGFTLVNAGALPTSLDLGETFELEVAFQPMATGVESAELRVFAGGQSDPIIIPIVAEGVASGGVSETFSFDSRTVDILFVVDDASRTDEAQAALAAAMPAFVDRLVARGTDFHVGVISTDMSEPTESGRLLGVPAVLDATTPMLADALAQRVALGTSGEREGISAAAAAVSAPLATSDNAGFLRPGADLAVVFVARLDDDSPAAVSVAQHLATLRQAAGSGRLVVGALAGVPGDGFCTMPQGTPVAEAPRIAQLVYRAGGVLRSLCSPVASELDVLTDAIVGAPSFALGALPRPSTIDVSVGGMTLAPSDWTYEPAENRVVIHDGVTVPNGATVRVDFSAACVSATCGDGTIDANEDCDDGNTADDDACSSTCAASRCGDGVTWTGVEQCDDGNLDDGDACTASCTTAVCGDGFVQRGVEECDDGNTSSGDACPATCRYYEAGPLTSATFTLLDAPIALVPAGGGNNGVDDGLATIALPFAFTFFDVTTSTLTVSVNGVASVGAMTPDTSYTNTSFPDATEPNGLLAPWWDDLFLDSNIADASLGYQVFGTAPTRTVVVQWRRLRRAQHSTNNHRRFTFQLAIEEGTNRISFRYGTTETAGNPATSTSASVGIEDASGGRGLEPLGCSPNCAGPARPQNPNGFPAQSELVFTP